MAGNKRKCGTTENKPEKRKSGMAENKPKKRNCGKVEDKSKKRKCGLCGKSKKLTKTPCCNNWICNDQDKYVMFSYKKNSCYRNHDRYTLCSSHFTEEHEGDWQNCEKCKADTDTPNYVYYGTNDYNFEKLENPEKISISCTNCGFTADTLDAFPLQASSKGTKSYYCAKKECQTSVFKDRKS